MPLATSRTYALHGTGLINPTIGTFYAGGASCSMTYFLANMLRQRTCTFTASDWGSVSSTAYMFDGDSALDEVHLPAGIGNDKIIDGTNTFNNCNNLTHITNLEFWGSRTSNCNFTNIFGRCEKLAQSLTIGAKLSKISLGGSSTVPLPIPSLVLTNGTSTFGGSSPQVDVQYCAMDATALNALFTSLPTVSGKTIKITGCTGAGTCNTSIATNKGWIISN